MSQWVTRIQEHGLWNQMAALGLAIDQAAKREGNEPSATDSIERVRAVLDYVGKKIASIDPILVSPSAFDNLSACVSNARSELEQYAAGGNSTNLQNANLQMDAAIMYSAPLLQPTASTEMTALNEAAGKYRQGMTQHLERFTSANAARLAEIQDLTTKITDLTNLVNSEKERLTTLTTEYQNQFSTAQDSRLQEYSKAQTERQDKFGAMMSEYGTKLTEKNAEFTNKLTEESSAFDQQKTKIEAEHVKKLGELSADYEDKAAQVLREITAHKVQVEKLVGVIGNLGVTSGYLKNANVARITMWVWQAIAVGSFATIVGIAYSALTPLVQGTLGWDALAARLFMSVAVGILAAYAAAQADKAWQAEKVNRRLALELEALGPFLAPLPEDKQHDFRLQVGDRSFGRPDGKEESTATMLDTIPQLKQLKEFVVDIVKAVRN